MDSHRRDAGIEERRSGFGETLLYSAQKFLDHTAPSDKRDDAPRSGHQIRPLVGMALPSLDPFGIGISSQCISRRVDIPGVRHRPDQRAAVEYRCGARQMLADAYPSQARVSDSPSGSAGILTNSATESAVGQSATSLLPGECRGRRWLRRSRRLGRDSRATTGGRTGHRRHKPARGPDHAALT